MASPSGVAVLIGAGAFAYFLWARNSSSQTVNPNTMQQKKGGILHRCEGGNSAACYEFDHYYEGNVSQLPKF